jgi:hypothetical protein
MITFPRRGQQSRFSEFQQYGNQKPDLAPIQTIAIEAVIIVRKGAINKRSGIAHGEIPTSHCA